MSQLPPKVVEAISDVIAQRNRDHNFFYRNACTRHGVPTDPPVAPSIEVSHSHTHTHSTSPGSTAANTDQRPATPPVTSPPNTKSIPRWAVLLINALVGASLLGAGGAAGVWLTKSPATVNPAEPPAPENQGDQSLLQYLEDNGWHISQ